MFAVTIGAGRRRRDALRSALPWMLASYSSLFSPWHLAHVDAIFLLATCEAGFDPFFMSWTPWQSVHVAAASFPCLIACP